MRTAPVQAPPLIDSLGLLERAVGFTRLTLAPVTPAMLERPTPCARWDLGDLLDHMADSLDALTEAADLGQIALSVPDGPPSPVGAVERLRVTACSLLGAWSAATRDADIMVGDRPLSSSLLACAGALEVAAHGWDVSQATGQRLGVPAQLAADLLAWVPLFVTDADRPHRFAPPLAVPMAGPSTRLLAVLGRRG